MRSLTTCLHAMGLSVGLGAREVFVPRGLGSFGFHEHRPKLRCCRASLEEIRPPPAFNFSAADGVSVAPRKYPPLLRFDYPAPLLRAASRERVRNHCSLEPFSVSIVALEASDDKFSGFEGGGFETLSSEPCISRAWLWACIPLRLSSN